MLYIFLLSLIIVLLLVNDIKKRQGWDTSYSILCIIFIVVTGLSYRVGSDTLVYEDEFYSFTGGNAFKSLISEDMFQSTREPLWVLLNTKFLSFFGNFQFFKLAIAAFVNITIFWFAKKHTSYVFTFILLYGISLFFHINFEVLRESLAISFFLIGYNSICGEKKNYVKYYLWIIPAILCHHFALFLLLVPSFHLVKPGLIFIIVFAAIVVIAPFLNDFLGVIQFFDIDEGISSKVETYVNSETYGVADRNIKGYLFIMLNLTPAIWFIYFSENNNFKSIALVFLLVEALNATSLGIFFRINDFLFFPMIISFIDGINNTIYRQTKMYSGKKWILFCFSVIMLLVYVGLAINKQISSDHFWEYYYPYKSVLF